MNAISEATLDKVIGTRFDSKNLSAIGTYLHYQKINPFHYMIAPAGHTHVKYEMAMIAELNFTSRGDYLWWVERWKVLYEYMSEDTRSEFSRWTRQQRNAMMHIRMEGKKKSWAMKLARLANSQ